jgi:hypothetical protein
MTQTDRMTQTDKRKGEEEKEGKEPLRRGAEREGHGERRRLG